MTYYKTKKGTRNISVQVYMCDVFQLFTKHYNTIVDKLISHYATIANIKVRYKVTITHQSYYAAYNFQLLTA